MLFCSILAQVKPSGFHYLPPGGIADLCLADWVSTAAGDTLYTVEVVTDNGTTLFCLPRL